MTDSFYMDLIKKLNGLQEQINALRTIEIGGVWKDWTPASQTGWTALPTGTYKYCQVGKFVACQISITAGTSNSTVAEIELPITASTTSTINRGAWGWAMDNGTQLSTVGGYVISLTPSRINFFKTAADGAAWTNSGTKRIYCMFFYEAA